MANEITSAGVGGLFFTDYITNRVVEYLRQAEVIRPLVANFDASATNSKTYSIPVMPSGGSASALGESTDLSTNQAFAVSNVDISFGQIGLKYFITDIAAEYNVLGTSLYDKVAFAGAQNISTKIETDLATLFPALNGGTTVSATSMTVAKFLNGIKILETNNVWGKKVAVLHTQQVDYLRNAIGTGLINSNYNIGTAQSNGRVGQFYDVDIYQTNNVQVAATTTIVKYSGAMLAADSMVSPIAFVSWKPVSVKTERDESFRGTEIVIVSNYGVVEIADKAGVCLATG